MHASFNERYQRELDSIRPYLRKGEIPVLTEYAVDHATTNKDELVKLRNSLIYILNHYEFLAAGIRNGDISERLLRDSERGTVLKLFDVCQKFISGQRDARNRQAIYEHIEWLFVRWKEHPPGRWQLFVERIMGRPFYHARNRWIALTAAVLTVAVIVIGVLHLPGQSFGRALPEEAGPAAVQAGTVTGPGPAATPKKRRRTR